MTVELSDHPHFTRAVAKLAERRRVVAHSAIFNQQGLKVIDKGVAVDARLYDKLSQHRLSAPLAEQLSVEDAVNPAGLRDAACALGTSEPLVAALLDTPRIGDFLRDELALIPLPQPVSLQLTTMRETQPALWLHSLRSALVAGWLGARHAGTRHDVRMLCAAGLLHDLGMMHLDPALLDPDARFAGAQRRQLYSHPVLTVMLLERHHAYPRELLRAVLEHHEALDGVGYPRRIAGQDISVWGRILALVELTTALMEPGGRQAVRRLSLVLRMNHARYDQQLVRELLPLLRRLDDGGGDDALVEDVAAQLREIERLLSDWPAEPPAQPPLNAARVAAVQEVHRQCARVLSMLAEAGAMAPQLAQLGPDDAASVDHELTLILHEARWQVRAVARQLRRLWNRGDEELPSWTQAWLDRAERLHG